MSTSSDYPFDIFKLSCRSFVFCIVYPFLYCLSFYLRLMMITLLGSSKFTCKCKDYWSDTSLRGYWSSINQNVNICIWDQKQTTIIYMMEENMIANTMEEKDLGIIIDNKLNFQNHINKQVNKANQKLGLINRSFKYMDNDMFLQLFKSLVRSHLEYGSTVWSVANKKEAIIIENVQRRATRLIKEIQHLSYGNRLKHLGLPTLQYRRIRADVVETFKIIILWTK